MSTAKKKAAKKVAGKKGTKADLVRGIIARGLSSKQDPEAMLQSVIKATGFKRGLAQAYIKNNVPRVQAAKKVSSKKKVSKKK